MFKRVFYFGQSCVCTSVFMRAAVYKNNFHCFLLDEVIVIQSVHHQFEY